MKSWECYHECGSRVSELGAYVKISNNAYAHLNCYNAALARDVRVQLRKEVEDGAVLDAERQKEAAIAAWRAATRCPKCGVPMLSERPVGLPETFSTVLTSNGSTCTLCVRQEAGLRAAARGREASPPAPKVEPVTEEKPKDRFELIDI